MENKIILSPKKIVAKRFQAEFKGYNSTEVDQFLDVVCQDYQEFANMLNDSYEKIAKLEAEIKELKQNQTLTNEKMTSTNLNNNLDLLRRLSQLEKEVYKKEK